MKKTIKNAMSSLTAKLAALLFAFTCAGTAWGALSGTGTSSDPFLIGKLADLQEFRDAVNAGNAYAGKYVKLTADIDLDNAKWTPIANNGDSTKFGGTFDGDSHTISNFYIDETTPAYHATGFFGAINGTIKNLKFVNAKVAGISSGPATVNGIAVVVGAMPYGGTIDNVSVENATVRGNRYVAGIVGYVSGTVKNCTVKDITVVATPDNLSGAYDNGDKAGGICGYTNTQVANTIENNTLSGTVNITAHRDVGGVIGMVQSGTTVSGNTVAEDAKVSIIVDKVTGNNSSSVNADWLIGRNASAASSGVEGKTVAEVNSVAATASTTTTTITEPVAKIGSDEYGTLAAATYAYQSGDTIEIIGDASSMTAPEGWIINPGTPATLSVDPMTTWTKVADGFYQSAEKYVVGNGMDIYITSKAGLEYFRDLVNGVTGVADVYASTYWNSSSTVAQWYSNNIFNGMTVHLMTDIDLGNEEWAPIGQPQNALNTKCYFYGHFNGENHTISNLKATQYTEATKTWYAGLFGMIGAQAGQTISNLTINNVTLIGYDYAGAIVGNAGSNATAFNNCHVTGNIDIKCTMVDAFVGGIVGIGTCAIDDCSVEGGTGSTIQGSTVGGLAGTSTRTANENANTVTDSTVTGVTVKSDDNGGQAGGLVGKATNPVTVTGNTVHDVTVSAEKGDADALVSAGTATASNNTTDTNVTIVEHFAAQIGETKYKTLKEAINAVGDGDVVIELLDDATLDYNAREAYGTAGTTKLTIKGNGKTLTLNQKDSDWSSLGLKNAEATLAFENITINKTGYGETGGSWNTHAIIVSSKCTMDNVTVNQSLDLQKDATLTNVTINEANGFYGLWLPANGQTVTFEGGSINATNGGRGIKIADQYVGGPESVKLTLKDLDINTAAKAAVLVTSTAGAEITATDVDITDVAKDSENIVWVDEERSTKFGEVTLNGGQTYPEGGPTEYAATLSSDGKIEGYYKTLDAVVAAYKEGDTITALNYVEGTTVVPEGWVAKTNGGVTTLEEAPKGTITVGYVNASRGVWGEADSNAKESFSVKVYSGETLLGTTTLNNIGGIIDGSVNVTWSALLPSVSDEYWTTVWEEDGLAWNKAPTKVELWVDGVKVAENVAQLNGPDGVNPIRWMDVEGVAPAPFVVVRDGATVDMFGTIAEAVAAAQAGDTIQATKVGTYTLPALPKNITIEGTVEGVVFNHTSAGDISRVSNGATFKNVSFNLGNVDYHGFQHQGGVLAFEGCSFEGKFFSYGDMVFTNCNFHQNNKDYHMWVYGPSTVEYTGCTFVNEQTGKFINVYRENSQPNVVKVSACKFINNGTASKAALNVKSTSGNNPLTADVIVDVKNCSTEGAFPTAETSDATGFIDAFIQIDDEKENVSDKVAVAEGTDIVLDENNKITGGIYKVIDTALIASGYAAVPNEDQDTSNNYPLTIGGPYIATVSDSNGVVKGGYSSFAAALAAVQDGETITVLDATGNESGTELTFDRQGDIAFTITGTAPNYRLPIITFADKDGSGGKITVTIKDATLSMDEIDARQNATVNVVDSFIDGKGGNTIVKSYFNGAINISGTSKVYTMQVTTMGYITISDSATLTATWQANVYGNGLISVNPGATFNTAALNLTGQAYSGRDNTDADRVGKPAAVIVDGATLNVGVNAYSSSGADYNYNSTAYGINVGTVDGKSAILDIKNDSTVVLAQGSGSGKFGGKVSFGAGATVNVTGGSSLTVQDRGTAGVTLTNQGTVALDAGSSVTAPEFVSEDGKVTVDMANFDGTLPLTVVTTTGGEAVLGDFEVYNISDTKIVVDTNGDLSVVAKVYVAQLGNDGQKFETLAEAVEAAQEGDTVKLIADVAYELTSASKIGVTIDKSITLDGNGHKITLTGEYAGGTYGIHVDSTAAITPTFKNLTIAASGIERAVRFSGAAGGTLDHVTLTTDAVGIHIKGTGDVEISNSSITTKPNDNTHYTAHLRSAVMHGSSATVTLTDNTIVAQAEISSAEMNHKAKGVYVGTGAVGTVVLESGNAITADIALAIDGAETGAGAGPSNKNHLIVQAGNTVTGAWASTGYKFKLLTIDGGDYYDLSTPDLTTLGKADSDGNLQISVTGGTFPIDVTAYCAEGYTCVPSEDRYVVQVAAGKVARNVEQNKAYASLADAFAEATAGQTVQLLVDQANLGTVAIPANVILDGNGLTLSGTSYLAVNAAGGTVKNVNFNAIGARNATTPAITANDLAGALVVEGCTFANGKTGYNAETDVAVTTVADASVKIIGNTFTGKTEKNYVIVQGAAAYAAEITGNVFNAGAKTRAFAVVNGGENVVASGNYVADGLFFGVSTNGVNGSELAYPQLASPTAATAEKAIPTFIVKNSPDGYPAIKGYAALADAFTDAVTGETILMTADATLDAAAVAASKSLVLDGQGFTLTASSDWSMKGTKAATSSPDGSVTLQKITLKYDAASDYATARLGGNVTLGENVVIDASAVTTPNAVLATGIAVAAGATPEVKAGSAVQAGDTLISALTLGEGASVEVSGLPTGLFDAIADNALALRTQEAKVTVGETVTYYNTLQEALNAAATAGADATVDVLCDVDLTGKTWTPVSINAGTGGKFVTVNGGDHTIAGLTEMLFSGTWAGNTGLAIKDLTIKDSAIAHDPNDTTGDQGVGAFIGWPQASQTISLTNCHLVNSSVEGGHWTGGLVGIAAGYSGNDGPVFETVTISGCSVENSTIKGKGSAGGVIGHGASSDWTKVIITDTTVTGNTVTSTGSSTDKAGAVCGTVGAAGQEKTVNGITHEGGIEVSATVTGNTASSGGTATTAMFGRIGSDGGELAVTGGTYDGTATYANDSYDSNNGKIIISGGTFQTQPSQDAIADGYVAELSQDVNGWWTVGGPFVAKIGNVGYATLAEAANAAVANDTIEIIVSTDEMVPRTKAANVTYTASEGVVLSGGVDTNWWQYDVTLDGLAFTGKGASISADNTAKPSVTVKNCTFTECAATAKKEGALSIKGSPTKVTVENCTITDVQQNTTLAAADQPVTLGMYIIGGEVSVVGNTVSGVGQSAIYVQTDKAITITDNVISDWGSCGKGRAIRLDMKDNTTEPVVVARNVMSDPDPATKEAFVQIARMSDAGNVNVAENYWGGAGPFSTTADGTLLFSSDNDVSASAMLAAAPTWYASYSAAEGLDDLRGLTAYVVTSSGAMRGGYTTLASALAAAQEGDTVEILAAEISEGSVTFPATLKNVTIKAADGVAATLKDMTLNSATGSAVDYEGITIDGLVFDNSRILFTGQRTGEVVYKDWTIANCTFTNIVSGTTAAVHFGSFKAGETMDGLTFTNNVIDGVSGGSRSGLLVNRMSGDVLIEGNLITNVAWNAIQLFNAPEGSTVTITNNLLSSKAEEGVVNLYGNKAAMAISGNAIIGDGEGVANVAYLSTAIDVAGNCWGGGEPALSGTQEGGSILCASYYASYSYDEATRVLTFVDEVGAVAVVKTGDTLKGTYYSLEGAIAAAASGDTVTLLADVTCPASIYRYDLKDGITLDGAGHTITHRDDTYVLGGVLQIPNGATVAVSNVTVVSAGGSGAGIGTGTGSNLTLENVTIDHSVSFQNKRDALALNGDCTIKGDFAMTLGENNWSAISFNTTNETLDFSECTTFTVTDNRVNPTQPVIIAWTAGSTVTGFEALGYVPVEGSVNTEIGYEPATSAKVGTTARAGTTYNYKVGDTYYTTFALAASVAVNTENAVENFADPAETDSYALANGSTLKVTKNGHEPAVVTTPDGEYVIYENTAETLTTYTTATAIAKIGDTYYSTFDEVLAVVAEAEQAGEPDPTIIVLADPQATQPPTGWTFVTDEATPPVTTLQRAVAQNQTTGKQYATIQAAIDDALAEDTVEVLRNVTLAEGLEIAQSITLTGAVNDDGTPKYTVTGPADLTSASSPVAGDIFVADDDGAVVVTISNLKLDGFGKDVASDGSASVVSFYAYEEGSALTVENVEFSNYSAFAVATVGSDGLLTVKDCAMEGAGGVLADGADAKVVGGTMTGVAEGVVAESGASVEIDGLAVSVATDGKSVVVDAQSKATIAGGVFAGKMLAGGLDVSQQGKGADLSISGGVFENYVYEEYCAADHVAVDYAGDVAAYAGWYQVVPGSYVASVTHEGAVKYYASLESALVAAESGDTVTLLADVELADRIWMKSGVTLDGDGHSIKPDATSANFNNPRLATDSSYAASSSLTVINLAAGVTDVTIKNVTLDSNNVYPRALIGTAPDTTLTLEDVTLNHTSTTIRGADALALNGDCTIKGDFTVALGERSWSAISFNTTNENLDLSDCTSFTVTADDRTGTQPLVFTWNSAGSTVTGADAAGLVSVNGTNAQTGFESVAASDKLGSATAASTYNFKVGNAYYTTFALAAPVAVDTENAVENFADPEAAYTLAQGSTLKVAKNGHEPTIQTDGGAYVIAEATTGDVTTYSTETAAVSVTDGTDTAYFTTLEEAFGIVEDGDTVTLLANVTLTADAAATPAANANVTLAQGEFSITADGHAIALSGSPLLTVTTDKQTDAFDAAAGYVIVESGSYVYTPTKIVAMIGETPYTTFADAVEAVQDGETITVVGYDDTMEAPEGWKFVTDDTVDPAVTTLVRTVPNVSVSDGTTTKTYETLQQAFNAAHEMSGDVTVTMLTDLAECALIHQKAGLNVTVDGQGKTLTGQIIIDGNGRLDGTDTLTITGINFVGTASDLAYGDTFVVVSNDKANHTGGLNSYAHCLMIANCTFTGDASDPTSLVGFRTQSNGGSVKNLTVTNVVATQLHSLAQLTGSQDVTFVDCTVTDCENGVNVSGGNGTYAFTGNTFDVSTTDGYGIRLKDATTAVAVLEGNTIAAKNALALGKNDEANNKGVFEVKSGTYNGALLKKTVSADAKFVISGGYFPTAVLPEYCAPNYVPVDAEDGAPLPYTVVEVVAEFRYPIEGTSGIPVTTDWFTNYLSSIYGSDPTAPVRTSMTNELVQALSADGANGMPLWQSYVLGLDPTSAADAFRLTATATGATAVTISVPAIDTAKFPRPAGTTVTFRLASRNADGTWTDIVSDAAEPVFEKSLDEVAGQVLRIFADIVTE